MLVPLHAPLDKSITASKLAEPITVIICVCEFATNEYQTSSLAVPPQVAGSDCVAPPTFPVTVPPQVAPYTVKGNAPAHSSFAGAGGGGPGVVTHIVNEVVEGVVL